MEISCELKNYYTNCAENYYKDGTFYNINKPSPKLVTIKPTLKCVANCLHCSPRSKTFDNNRLITLNEYKKLFEELKAMGVENICVSGGEPLLYEKIVDLVALITKSGMKPSINTNGWLLTPEKLKKLLEVGLLTLNVSIDSPIAEKHDGLRNLNGLFNRTIFQLKQCSYLDIPFLLNIRMVLSKFNYNNIEEMLELIEFLNADALSIDMIEADSDNKFFLLNSDEIKEFKEIYVPKIIEKIYKMNIKKDLKEFNVRQINDLFNTKFNSYNNFENGIYWPDDKIKSKCDIPSTFMIIEGDGSVLPCNAVEYNRDKIVGNIFDDSIEEIWESEKWNNFRDNKMDFCRKCPMNMSYMLMFNNKKIVRKI